MSVYTIGRVEVQQRVDGHAGDDWIVRATFVPAEQTHAVALAVSWARGGGPFRVVSYSPHQRVDENTVVGGWVEYDGEDELVVAEIDA